MKSIHKNWNITVSFIIHEDFDHAWAEHYPVTLNYLFVVIEATHEKPSYWSTGWQTDQGAWYKDDLVQQSSKPSFGDPFSIISCLPWQLLCKSYCARCSVILCAVADAGFLEGGSVIPSHAKARTKFLEPHPLLIRTMPISNRFWEKLPALQSNRSVFDRIFCWSILRWAS